MVNQARTPAGRPPSLTARGQIFFLSGALLVILGALQTSWALAVLGLSALTALSVVYVQFYPASVLLWRRFVDFSWGIERGESSALIVGRPFRVSVRLRCAAPRSLGRARLTILSSSALEPAALSPIDLAAERQVTASFQVRPLAAGSWFLHGAALSLSDRFGLVCVEAYFASPLEVKIFPRPGLKRMDASLQRAPGAPQDQLGPRPFFRRGLGGDLRELREHLPGDPFKQIAWKATARTGKLMVREMETETLVTHLLVLDVGASMRNGKKGSTKLDRAVDLACAYAVSALSEGDRVGLVKWGGRAIEFLAPGDGPVQKLRIVERLMDSVSAPPAAIVSVTDSELVEQVAQYLLFQEGIDARVRKAPPLDDIAWGHLSTGATGALYDARIFEAAMGEVPATDSPPQMEKTERTRMIEFCRTRGIELPAHSSAEKSAGADHKARGLRSALETAARSCGQKRIVVLSDFDGIEAGLPEVGRAVGLSRKRGHQLLFVHTPELPPPDAPLWQREILKWRSERRERATVQSLSTLGVRTFSPTAIKQPELA